MIYYSQLDRRKAQPQQPTEVANERNTEMKSKLIHVCFGVALTAAMFALPPVVVIVGIVALPLVLLGR